MRRFICLSFVAVIIGALLPLVLTPTSASAHAYLARSAPADGAVLDRAPELLTLGFTERVELPQTHVEIVDGDGQGFSPTSVTARQGGGTDGGRGGGTGGGAGAGTDGAALASGTDTPMEVLVGLPNLPPNVYHVTWSTLSSDDLHTTGGNLVIGVQRQVPAAKRAPGPGGPVPLEATLRGLGLLGLSVLLGGAALALLMAGRFPELRRRLLDVAATGGGLALVATPAQLIAQVYAGTGGAGRLLAHEAASGRWLARELGVAALTAAVLWARAGLRSRDAGLAVIALGAGGAAAAAVGSALLGHQGGAANALGANGIAANTIMTAVHVLGAGAWAGSVLAAGLALVPVLRLGSERGAAVAALLRAFGAIAVTAVTALTVTGLLMTGRQVATVDGLLTTPYGVLLLGKVGLVGVAGLLGLRTARRLRREGAAVPVRGLIAEAVVFVAVLGLAGALASAGPARGPRFDAGPTVKTVPQVSGQAADLVDTVAIRPNVPGRNVITVTVADTRRPALAAIGAVTVILTAPDGTQTVHPVTRAPDGSWTVATDDIRAAGAWTVSVTVLRDGLPAVTDAHDWGVAGARAGAPAVVSSAPLPPAVTILAAVVAVGTVGGGVLWYRRRRRSVAPAAEGREDGDGVARPEGGDTSQPGGGGAEQPELVTAAPGQGG